MTLGERIKQARESLGWSGNRLAQIVGTSQPTIQRLENNETDGPSVFLIAAIAKALGVSLDELVGEVALTPRPTTKAAKTDDRVAQLEAKLSALEATLSQGAPQKPHSKKGSK